MNQLKNYLSWLKVLAMGLGPLLLSVLILGLVCKLVKICFQSGYNLLP